MAEIYRNSTRAGVTFGIPRSEATVSAAKIIRNGEETATTYANGTGDAAGKTVAKIPFTVARYDGHFDVEWTFKVGTEVFVQRETHEIVTPLFSIEELKRVDPDFTTISDTSIKELERLIRALFESLTGQSFGLESGTLSFLGNGGSSINLPKRSAEPVGPTYGDGPAQAITTNEGWVVEGYSNDSWILKFEPDFYPSPLNTFHNGRRYYLQGLWGYYSVPEDIVLAATTLAQDYGCDQSLWQARYLKSIRMADMRFEFDGRAFSRTGNLRVDQIIDRYTRVRAGIL